MYANDTVVESTVGQSVINTDLLTETVSGWMPVSMFRSATFMITGSAGISAGAVIFEQTNNPVLNPTGLGLPSIDGASTPNFATVSAVTVAASTSYLRVVPNLLCNYVRVRISTGFVGGTVQVSAVFSPIALTETVKSSIVQANTANPLPVHGQVAEDSPTTANPLVVGGVVRTALPASTLTGNDAVRLTMSQSAQAIIKPYAVRQLDFFVNSVVTTATQTAIRAAQGASIVQNITGITYQNTSATATLLTIQDGSNTLIPFNCPANMADPVQLTFLTPLSGTANTAINYTAGTAGANVLLNVTGFNSY